MNTDTVPYLTSRTLQLLFGGLWLTAVTSQLPTSDDHTSQQQQQWLGEIAINLIPRWDNRSDKNGFEATIWSDLAKAFLKNKLQKLFKCSPKIMSGSPFPKQLTFDDITNCLAGFIMPFDDNILIHFSKCLLMAFIVGHFEKCHMTVTLLCSPENANWWHYCAEFLKRNLLALLWGIFQ